MRRARSSGRDIWTKGFDKRFCNDRKDLAGVVEYIKGHGRISRFVYVEEEFSLDV